MKRPRLAASLAGCAVAMLATGAQAQGNAADEIAKYRQMLQDGNPAELLIIRGEELWKQKRGPKGASLEQCDLGLGAGVVKGAYAQLPRHFADTNQVMDFEARLVHCMVTLQGFDRAAVTKSPFSGAGQRATDIESITTFVVEQSRGVPVKISQSHPMERAAFERGRQLFYMRGGPYDFSCATCHAGDNTRIRLQDLPNLTKQAGAQLAYTGWPAYRVSQGELRTFQWRLNDCFRQQRFPELKFTSDASIALTAFLARNANGAEFKAPTIKR